MYVDFSIDGYFEVSKCKELGSIDKVIVPPLSTSTAAYAIVNAAIGTDDVTYSCVAFVDTMASEPSDDFDLMCKPILFEQSDMVIFFF